MRKLMFGAIIISGLIFFLCSMGEQFCLFSIGKQGKTEMVNQDLRGQKKAETVNDSSENLERALIKVDEMTCESCALGVKYTLTSLKGVKEVKVSFNDNLVDVVFEPKKINDSVLVKRINEIGYKASLIKIQSLKN